MFAHRSHRQVEMTAGPLLPNVLAFAVPLILSGMLQLLYNSADIIVVGRFADSVAMASVGATTSLIHLLVSLLMGLNKTGAFDLQIERNGEVITLRDFTMERREYTGDVFRLFLCPAV